MGLFVLIVQITPPWCGDLQIEAMFTFYSLVLAWLLLDIVYELVFRKFQMHSLSLPF